LKSIKGTGAPFSVTRVGGSAVPLPSGVLSPGATIELEVHYRPTIAAHHEASIEIAFDSGETALLEVSGDAIEAGALSCTGPIDFGGVPRGSTETRPVECTVS
jgi:hypothetical protein